MTESSRDSVAEVVTTRSEDEFVPAQPSRMLDLAIAAIALAVTGTFFALTFEISSRVDAGGFTPREWPQILSALGMLLSIVLLVEAIRRKPWQRDELESASRDGWRHLAITAVILIVYVVAWSFAGFIVPTAIFLLTLLLAYGVRNPIALIAFPIGVTAGIYLVFRVILRVPL